ncbi:WbqC family protein [Streptomyces sp. ODS28]|uniref:WbqC family protein n=1 Tax=Streptomyces sp. ODS28 TaxID=3136688 RepID=UPI0031EAF8BA
MSPHPATGAEPRDRTAPSAQTVRVAAHQPGYHRHLYYFYKMAVSDVFVSLDTVQFAAREWQNRQVFVRGGERRWLSVPVNRGREPIRDKRIADHGVLRDHWATLSSLYRSTPYFARYAPRLEEIYSTEWTLLRDLCDALTGVVREALDITTPYLRAGDLIPHPSHTRGALLAELARSAAVYAQRLPQRGERPCGERPYETPPGGEGAGGVPGGTPGVEYLACATPMREDHYLMRASAQHPALTERQVMERHGVTVGTFPYRHPVYPQRQFPPGHPFEAELSAFDLLFNHGPRSRGMLLGAAAPAPPETDGDPK